MIKDFILQNSTLNERDDESELTVDDLGREQLDRYMYELKSCSSSPVTYCFVSFRTSRKLYIS
jgi:hypothetical protein